MLKKVGVVLALTGFLLSSSVFAQATRAGERIENTATATYIDASGGSQVTTSLAAVTVVSQVYRLDITPDTVSATGTFAATDATTNFTGVPANTNIDLTLPGGTTNFGYIISNPGNGNDTYILNVELNPADAGSPLTNVNVFLDTNGNSIADSGEPLIGSWVAATRTGTVSVPRNSSIRVVVSATTPNTVGLTRKLDLVGWRSVDAANAPLASFAAAATALMPRDRNNLSQVTTVSDAILDISVTPSGPNPTTGLINYTVSGTNSGNQCARSRPNSVLITGATPALPNANYSGILVDNAIPTTPVGTVFNGTATGSSGGALTFVIYQTAATAPAWTATAPAAASVTRVGLLILPASPVAAAANTSATPSATLCASADYTLNFGITVPTNTPAGTTITDTAAITSVSAASAAVVTTTGNATSTMPTILGVAIAPNGLAGIPNASVLPGAFTIAANFCTDPVTSRRTPVAPASFAIAGTTGLQVAATADRTEVPNAFPMNATACFINTIRNNGNSTQSFDVAFDSALSNLPANTQVALFQADGTNPLPSGLSIAAGATVNVIVKVTLDGAAAPIGAFNAVIRATSQTNSTITDITVDRLTSLVSGVSVEVFNNDTTNATNPATGGFSPAVPTGTTATPSSTTANAGSTVTFPLVIRNTGSSSDNFTLTATGAGIPSGGIITYYLDSNGNGVLDSGEPVATTTGVLAASSPTSNGVVQLIAVLTIPANASPQTSQPINFVATSTSNVGVSGAITNNLTINANNALDFTSDSTRTVSIGGTVIHTYTLVNNGNSNVTALQITPSAGLANFTYTVYLDDGSTPGSIDGTDTIISSVGATILTLPILPSGQRTVFVQVSTTTGVSAGDEDIRTIVATGTFAAGGTASDPVLATTRVVAGNIQVNKTASATASPRSLLAAPTTPNVTASEITYTISVANIGSAPVTNLIVLDAIPQFTDFKFASVVTNCATALPGATCTLEYSTDSGATWSTTAPTDTNANGYSDDAARVTNIRIVITNPTSTPVNAFPNGTTLTVTFVVSVR
jgi:trimeric autotransporter adhesin